MNAFRKIIALITAALLLLPSIPALADEGDIVIIYTNDIHTYIANNIGEGNENGLTYSKVAALRAQYENAILVDAGDHIQGTAYGGMDDGATIIRLMNAVGYDLATLGNHEFDYGMYGCFAAMDAAEFPYVSCNFRHVADGIPGAAVLDGYAMIEASGRKIAFVGITTPETLTSTTPMYFQDEAGNYIYGIDGGDDGAALYAAVQSAIDAAVGDGADYVIALGHLGVDQSSQPWTSRDVIENTAGLDAFIDGHSHTVMESEIVEDMNGGMVTLTQTGSYLGAIGMMTISPDGNVSARLLTGEDLAGLEPDADVKAMEEEWISEIDAQLGTVIGYAEVTLDNFEADGTRLVRNGNTNSGDFSTDALYYLFDSMDMDVDVAVMNGGGIRNAAITGEISYLTCKEIQPFGNVACLLTVSGQQLLDMFECSMRGLVADGSVEDGSFLHVSGARFTVDLSVPSTVRQDEFGVWTGGPTGEYRVRDLEIYDSESGGYLPVDPDAEYNLAGYNYTLRDLGGGFAMLEGSMNVLDYVAEDYMVLANYVQSFPVDPDTGLPTITEDSGYADLHGQGRINIIGTSDTAQ